MSIAYRHIFAVAGLSVSLASCGGAGFTGTPGSQSTKKSNSTLEHDDSVRQITPSDSEEEVKTEGASGDSQAATPGGEKVYTVAGATEEEAKILNSCLNVFKNNPFGSNIAGFKKIDAAISILGNNVPINDVEKTDLPSLILVNAAINIAGSPTYNMLNPNGYYCIKNSLNVVTNLTMNVSCSAQLADSSFKFDVLSNVNGGNVSKNGIYVASTVTVNDIKTDAAKYPCIR